MSILQRDRATASVLEDAGSGRPMAIRIGSEAIPVSAIDSIRDETFAYPAQSGPRTVFQVEAAGRRFRLVHQHQSRRWTVEALEDTPGELSIAA